ncbi:Negative regulator of mitotic exit [Tulasnella sp. 419]|nr:Negative regulator of mitotic exit [Tulasnella sp. 419]
MGPAPSGRSGHAMASAGSRVFVLGGESFTAPKPDDPSIVHVLDSRHIKYPDSSPAPQNNSTPNPDAGLTPSTPPIAQSHFSDSALEARSLSPASTSSSEGSRKIPDSPRVASEVPKGEPGNVLYLLLLPPNTHPSFAKLH